MGAPRWTMLVCSSTNVGGIRGKKIFPFSPGTQKEIRSRLSAVQLSNPSPNGFCAGLPGLFTSFLGLSFTVTGASTNPSTPQYSLGSERRDSEDRAGANAALDAGPDAEHLHPHGACGLHGRPGQLVGSSSHWRGAFERRASHRHRRRSRCCTEGHSESAEVNLDERGREQVTDPLLSATSSGENPNPLVAVTVLSAQVQSAPIQPTMRSVILAADSRAPIHPRARLTVDLLGDLSIIPGSPTTSVREERPPSKGTAFALGLQVTGFFAILKCFRVRQDPSPTRRWLELLGAFEEVRLGDRDLV